MTQPTSINPDSVECFKQFVSTGDFLILDSETTGLKRPAEIVDLAIVRPTGEIVFQELFRPRRPLPAITRQITGLTDEMLADKPTYAEMRPRILNILSGARVVAYNAKFDRHMLHCSDETWELPAVTWRRDSEQPTGVAHWHCAMEAYAEHYGEVNEFYGSYRWQKLTAACAQQGIEVVNAHRALGDALMTALLLKKVWA